MTSFFKDEETPNDPVIKTSEDIREGLNVKQKSWLRRECKSLLNQCEDFEDAKAYIGDVVSDMCQEFPELEKYWEQLRDVVTEELRVYS